MFLWSLWSYDQNNSDKHVCFCRVWSRISRDLINHQVLLRRLSSPIKSPCEWHRAIPRHRPSLSAKDRLVFEVDRDLQGLKAQKHMPNKPKTGLCSNAKALSVDSFDFTLSLLSFSSRETNACDSSDVLSSSNIFTPSSVSRLFKEFIRIILNTIPKLYRQLFSILRTSKADDVGTSRWHHCLSKVSWAFASFAKVP